jgi:hypothetical protein
MRLSSLLAACGAALLLAACTHRYTPEATRPFEPIPEFTADGAVALINGQASREPYEFFSPGFHSYIGDLHAWTEVVIEIAARELALRGVTRDAAAPKTLELAVISAETEQGWVKIGSVLELRVLAGNGYTNTYQVANNSTMVAILQRQLDGLVMRAAMALLSDPQIQAYLQSP